MRKVVVVAVLAILAAVHAAAQNPTQARKVADQMIAALGGDAFVNVREIETRGRFFSFKRNELTGGDTFADFIKFPDKERTEFGAKEKDKTVTINNGDEGWKAGPKGVEEQLPGEVEEFQADFKTSFDYVLRFVINKPETTLQYLGAEIVDFRRADMIEFRDALKNRIRFWVDRESGLPVKRQVRRVDSPELREEQYANFHEFAGVKFPLLVTRYTDGQKTMEIRAESVKHSHGLTDSLFGQPPAKSTR